MCTMVALFIYLFILIPPPSVFIVRPCWRTVVKSFSQAKPFSHMHIFHYSTPILLEGLIMSLQVYIQILNKSYLQYECRFIFLVKAKQLLRLSEILNLSCFLYVLFLSTYCCPGLFICFSHVIFFNNLPKLWPLARQSNGIQYKNRWTDQQIPVEHFDPYHVLEHIFTDLDHHTVNLPIVCNQNIYIGWIKCTVSDGI